MKTYRVYITVEVQGNDWVIALGSIMSKLILLPEAVRGVSIEEAKDSDEEAA
jgi:hypothetical protein